MDWLALPAVNVTAPLALPGGDIPAGDDDVDADVPLITREGVPGGLVPTACATYAGPTSGAAVWPFPVIAPVTTVPAPVTLEVMTGDAFGALKLTDTARGVLKGETDVMLREEVTGSRVRATRTKSRRGDVAPHIAGQAGAGNPTLVSALRAWRSEVARTRGVPAYVVLHDATIDGIAASRPTTQDQLRGIPGIGDKKLEHYGDELIALVKADRTET